MSHKFSLAALMLPLVCLCANAADVNVVGDWEGKSAKGKVVGLNFKEDKTLVTSEDGKADAMPGVSMKWDLVDAAKGHLDIVMTVEDKEVRIPMLVEAADGALTIGSPKEDGKRPAAMADSDDPIKFAKKGGGGIVGKWEGKSKSGKVIGLEFKADKSFLNTEDGKDNLPPGSTYEIVDAAKGHLDFILKVEDKEIRVPMIMEMKDGKLVIGGPKEADKRAASLDDSDDPVEFSKK